MAKALFAAMRAFENAVVIHVNGKRRLPPFGIEFFTTFRANVRLIGNVSACEPKSNRYDQHRRNDDRPPRNVVRAVEPIYRTRCQRKRHKADNKNKQSNAFFHGFPTLCSISSLSIGKRYHFNVVNGSMTTALMPAPPRLPLQTVHFRE